MKRITFLVFSLCIGWSVYAGNIDLKNWNEAEAKAYVKENLGLSIYKYKSNEIVMRLDTVADLIELYSLDSMRPEFYYLKSYVLGEYENELLLSIEYAKKTVDEAKKYGKTNEEIDGLLKLVEVYAETYQYDEAFYYSKLAKKRAQETNDIRRIATVNMTLARAHDKYDEYAVELYRDAYKMVGHIKHNNVAILLNNWGRVFLFMDKPQLDSAVFYLEAALALKNELDAASLGNVECNLAEAYFAQGRFDKVEELCTEVLAKDEDNKTTVEAFNCRRMLARTRMERGDQIAARKYIDEGVKLAAEYPFLHQLIKKFSGTVKSVSEELEDLRTYTLLDSLYQNASDSLAAEEEKKQISIIEAKMQLSKKDAIIEKQERISGTMLVILLCSLGLLIFGGIGFYQYYQRRMAREALAEKEMELLKTENERNQLGERVDKQKKDFAERQASTNLIHLKEKQKILNEVRSRIADVDLQRLPEEAQKSFIEIEKLIDENLRSEQQWNDFLTHYENIHPSFFTKLKMKHPSLSPQDRRLIAYLKMELSSKEIAQLMGVNHQSVNKSRYRLRKKLSVPKEVKLDEYLLSL